MKTHELEKNGTAKAKESDVINDIELKNIELRDSLSDAENGEKDKFINGTYKAPFDKKNLVYIIFIIHGIGNLMPWNMFITAKSYYTDFKLNVNLTDSYENATLTDFRDRFMPITSIASQAPNLLFNGLNLFLAYYSSSIGINLFRLVIGSIVTNIIIMSFTCVLVVLDSQTWPLRFFILTIISIVLLNVSNGFYQNSIYGAAAKLPMKYTNAVIFGNNISGTIISIVNIFTLSISPDLQTAAFLYFFASIVILIACLITFKQLMGNNFYKHHTDEQVDHKTTSVTVRPSYMYILKHCGEQCFNVFLTFFVTLILFPAILSTIKQSGTTFSERYFTPLFCFLNFNTFAMIGNVLPNYFIFPSPKRLWIPVCLRLLFIPFFLCCNYKPSVYTFYFTNDWFFIIGTMLMGVSHGYLSSLGMMYAPKTVAKEHTPIAGMLSAFCLICGITSGISASILF